MTAVEQWACKPWCQAANPYVAVACDCGMAGVRALAADGDRLRAMLGLLPGDTICGATALDPWTISGPAATCLLPASHIEDGHWHRGLGGSWSL